MIHLPEGKPGKIISLGAELETISEENKIKFCQTINLIKELEEKTKIVKEAILKEMEERNIKTVDIGNIQISYREGFEKLSVDSKKLKEDGAKKKSIDVHDDCEDTETDSEVIQSSLFS